MPFQTQGRERDDIGKYGARLVELWNLLPEVKPLRRFTDRATAVRRIWEAVQVLGAAGERGSTAGMKRPRSRLKASKTKRRATARKGTKTEKIRALLQRPAGATLAALMRATQWQAHSVRGLWAALEEYPNRENQSIPLFLLCGPPTIADR